MKRLGEFPRDARVSKYPWDKLLDGSVWEILPKDVPVSFTSFRACAQQAAKRRGGKIRSVIKDGCLIIQFFVET